MIPEHEKAIQEHLELVDKLENVVAEIEEVSKVVPESCLTYRWYEYLLIDNEWRYIVPRADPNVYEFALDFEFATHKDAVAFLFDWLIPYDEYKDWVLCKERTEPLTRGKDHGIWCEECGEHFPGGDDNYPEVAYDQHNCKEVE